MHYAPARIDEPLLGVLDSAQAFSGGALNGMAQKRFFSLAFGICTNSISVWALLITL